MIWFTSAIYFVINVENLETCATFARIFGGSRTTTNEGVAGKPTKRRDATGALLRHDTQSSSATGGEYGQRARQDSRWTFVTIWTTSRFGSQFGIIIVAQVKAGRLWRRRSRARRSLLKEGERLEGKYETISGSCYLPVKIVNQLFSIFFSLI